MCTSRAWGHKGFCFSSSKFLYFATFWFYIQTTEKNTSYPLWSPFHVPALTYAEYFIIITSFGSQNHPLWWEYLLLPFCRLENRGSGRLSNFPKGTQILSGRARIQILVNVIPEQRPLTIMWSAWTSPRALLLHTRWHLRTGRMQRCGPQSWSPHCLEAKCWSRGPVSLVWAISVPCDMKPPGLGWQPLLEVLLAEEEQRTWIFPQCHAEMLQQAPLPPPVVSPCSAERSSSASSRDKHS